MHGTEVSVVSHIPRHGTRTTIKALLDHYDLHGRRWLLVYPAVGDRIQLISNVTVTGVAGETACRMIGNESILSG